MKTLLLPILALALTGCAAPTPVETIPVHQLGQFYRDFDNRIIKRNQANIEARAAQLGATPEEIELARSGTFRIGFSEAALNLAMGRPDDINRTITASGERRQYVYRDYGAAQVGARTYPGIPVVQNSAFVYVEGGRVTAAQD